MAKVSEAIAPVISVDRKASDPLHKQIYDGFRSAIVRGNLRPGQRVPSSRALAVELRISRIPVLNAYGQLLAEGYFESRKGAGTFISALSAGKPDDLQGENAAACAGFRTAAGCAAFVDAVLRTTAVVWRVGCVQRSSTRI